METQSNCNVPSPISNNHMSSREKNLLSRVTLEISQASRSRDSLQIRSGREQGTFCQEGVIHVAELRESSQALVDCNLLPVGTFSREAIKGQRVSSASSVYSMRTQVCTSTVLGCGRDRQMPRSQYSIRPAETKIPQFSKCVSKLERGLRS